HLVRREDHVHHPRRVAALRHPPQRRADVALVELVAGRAAGAEERLALGGERGVDRAEGEGALEREARVEGGAGGAAGGRVSAAGGEDEGEEDQGGGEVPVAHGSGGRGSGRSRTTQETNPEQAGRRLRSRSGV